MLSKVDDSALTADAGTSISRCAVYWVPCRGHPLWRAGCEWLGRDPEMPRIPVRLAAPHELTREPRRYGFHATLKAPMRLRDGARIDTFTMALTALAATLEPFAMPTLEVRWLDNFLALRPAQDVAADHALRRLADTCVRSLEPWRDPRRQRSWPATRRVQGPTTSSGANARNAGATRTCSSTGGST